jgi:tetratricopeptide (TPR) repeat protein
MFKSGVKRMPMVRPLSVKERILVYLHDFGELHDLSGVADQLTQEYIMQTVDAPRGSVSRALKGLMEKELVRGELAHVSGGKRRQKAYVLTFQGYSKVDDMVLGLLEQQVRSKDKEGDIRKQTLADAWEGIKTEAQDLNLVDVLMLCEEADVLDLESLAVGPKVVVPVEKGPPTKQVEREDVVSPKVVKRSWTPEVLKFFGRGRELKALEEAFGASRIVFIYGMPGMGKTTLGAKYVLDKKAVWVRVAEYHSLATLLGELAKGLDDQGWSGLDQYLDSVGEEEMDIGHVLSLLKQDLGDEDVILVFDDMQRANQRIVRFFGYLKDAIEDIPGLKFLGLSRRLVPFYDPRDVQVKGTVAEIELKGLDMSSSGEMLASVLGLDNIDDASMENIQKATGGHPMALELARSLESVSRHRDMDSFLQNEVLDDLGLEERGLLEIMSVFRRPEPAEAFMAGGDVRGDVLEKLSERGLTVTTAEGGFGLQELLRDSVYAWMSWTERVKNHEIAAKYYSDLLPVDGLQEAVHHFVEAGKVPEAADLVADQGPVLVSDGYAETVMDVLGFHDWSQVESALLRRLEDIREGILLTWGDWDNVLEHYYQSYLLTSSLKGEGGSFLEVRMRVGPLGWNVEELRAGIENQQRSLEVLGSDAEKGEILRSKAWNHWMLGELDGAGKDYKGSLDLLKDCARVHLGQANVHWDKSEIEEALKVLNKGLGLVQEQGDLRMQARFENNLGMLEQYSNNPAKARMHYSLALDLARRVNFLKGEAYVLLHLGHCLAGVKDEDGERLLRRARDLFDTLGDDLGAAYSRAWLGMFSDDKTNLFKEARKIMGDRGTDYFRSLLEK